MIGIYMYKNKINGKIYVGQSIDLQQRYNQHKRRAFQKNSSEYNTPLSRAIRKYGWDNFEYLVLQECSKEQLNSYEQYYIEQYNCLVPYGYNVTKGGAIGHPLKITYSDVEKIYSLLRETKLTNKEIGEQFNVTDQTISDINCGRSFYSDNIKYPIRKQHRNIKQYYFCKQCGKRLIRKRKNELCDECLALNKKQKIITRPSKEELYKTLKNNPNFTQVAQRYGVSDNAVRKWCKKYQLPYHIKDYK